MREEMTMNREEYMRRLEEALTDITPFEKEEALQYYNDYFDDAGLENEEEVMNSLGTPEKLAETIKKEQTDAQESADEILETTVQEEDKKNKLSGGTIALIVVLSILASPFIVAAVVSVLGAVIGIIAGIFSAIAALGSIFLAFIGIVIVSMISAIAVGAISPLGALVFAGFGIMMIGLSIFLLMAIVWLFGIAVPWVVKQIIHLCKKIFGKKGGNQ